MPYLNFINIDLFYRHSDVKACELIQENKNDAQKTADLFRNFWALGSVDLHRLKIAQNYLSNNTPSG